MFAVQRHQRIMVRKIFCVLVTPISHHELVVWRANQFLAIIEFCLNNFGTFARDARVLNFLNTDTAIFFNGIAKILFPLLIFFDELSKRKTSSVNERDFGVSIKTASGA